MNIYYFERWQGEGYVMTGRSPQKWMNGGFLLFILLLQECNGLHLMKMFWVSEVICCRPAPSYLFMNTRINHLGQWHFRYFLYVVLKGLVILWISKKKKGIFETKMTLWCVFQVSRSHPWKTLRWRATSPLNSPGSPLLPPGGAARTDGAWSENFHPPNPAHRRQTHTMSLRG